MVRLRCGGARSSLHATHFRGDVWAFEARAELNSTRKSVELVHLGNQMFTRRPSSARNGPSIVFPTL